MRTVLVTGGAGYVGSHTCKLLAASGYRPVVYDNLSRGQRAAVRWGPLVVGDLTDRARLDEAFAEWRPSAVIHFAALTYVGESVEKPALYHHVNVGGSRTLVEAATDAGVDRLVFSSTAAVYGTPQRTPIAEDHPLRPINPYGETKLRVEEMLAAAEAASGLRSVALRYFNAAGADPEGETGEDHEPETHAIPLAIQAVLGERREFRVFGRDYPTPDGTAVRDYVHVMDLAQAHLLALEHLERGGAGTQVNLGTGSGTSVAELLDAVARAAGRPVPAATAPRRAGDPPVLVADGRRAHDLLGWRPRFGSLDAIVETAWQWHTGALRRRRAA
ncbi:UDP-glucose 4-epimerase GalE [Rhodospirillum centenum]|uniref:UDP-glucose 4-epimerase n=1 Tax=Rhodospirillum centenum (strain ATCC 51521 / SW) TaxID=414684 RepID=B6IU48_RHOCS|nr:UDP-glucose 4-epimerase GalE [Rhodospirillum centenum]ACI99925.1 UDP-glucose 4-epimerase [Rhodospirillum centenum SW]